MILSILVCHVIERKFFLDDLLNMIKPQLVPGVEIIVDPAKYASIGAKRNSLLEKAKGEYVAYVDDDDLVSRTYVQKILDAVKDGPDCASLRGYLVHDEELLGVFEHSLKYDRWENDLKGYVKWTRPPNHLNAIKTSIARSVGFPDKDRGEDQDFSDRVRPLLHTEGSTGDDPIYQYIRHLKPSDILKP